MGLPLDVWNHIASLDVKVYHILITSVADFYRGNKDKQLWWLNHFGIKKYVGTELPDWVFDLNFSEVWYGCQGPIDFVWHMTLGWIEQCERRISSNPKECIEYYWTKDGYSHRTGGPAQMCTTTMNNQEIWKSSMWVHNGEIIKRYGFVKKTLRYSRKGKLFCCVGHGGWYSDYDLDEYLKYAKKQKEEGKWKYTIKWRLPAFWVMNKDDCWYKFDSEKGDYITTEFNKISNMFGWKKYLSGKNMTTRAIYKRLMIEK